MIPSIFRPWCDASRQSPANSVSTRVPSEVGASTSAAAAVQDVQRGEPVQRARRQGQEEAPRSVFSLCDRPEGRLHPVPASHHRHLPGSRPAICNWSPQAVHHQHLANTPRLVYAVDAWSGQLLPFVLPPVSVIPGWPQSTLVADTRQPHVQPFLACGATPGTVPYPVHVHPAVNYIDVHRSVASAAGRLGGGYAAHSLPSINRGQTEAAAGVSTAGVCKEEYYVSQAHLELEVPEYQDMGPPLYTSTPKKKQERPATEKKRKRTSTAKKNDEKPAAEKKEKQQRLYEKKHPCPYCGHLFYNKAQVNVHTRVHTGEKPFSCPFADCPVVFARKEERKRHIMIHTGERPFGCTICNRRFGRRDHLNKHRLAVHGTRE